MIGRARKRIAHMLDRRFFALHERVDHLAARVEDLASAAAERDADLRGAVGAATSRLEDAIAPTLRIMADNDAENRRLLDAVNARLEDEIAPALRIMAGNDAESRRLLDAARRDPEYELAFVEPEPLVTVIVPTYGRADLLSTRALPPVLAQSHERLQVLAIGDATDAETEAAVGQTDDSRVTFINLTQRYVYPDEHRHWLAATTLARNEGYRLASGRWLFDLDDDDVVPHDAIERLLADARAQRLEAVQGVIRRHAPEGGASEIVSAADELPLKGAVVHAHLRFFGREHVASAFGVPGDWFRGERMIRAGVRIGRLDHVTYEYYPSLLWGSHIESP